MRRENSGEPAALVAVDDSDLAGDALGIMDTLRELLAGDYDDGEEVTFYRKLMTDEEVEALPDL